MLRKRKIINSCFIVIAALFLYIEAEAKTGNMINPITDIDWTSVFPITIGGMDIGFGSSDLKSDTPPDQAKSPICLCKRTFGLRVGFWEPARISETVKDPYYFPTLGFQMSGTNNGFLYGDISSTSDDTSKTTNAQAHWVIFGVWNLLDLFLDFPCLDGEEIDIAYLTEVDPTWQDSMLGFMLNPEALLFANPVASMSCIADSAASNAGYPLSPMFWCMGSWGSAYPLTGTIGGNESVEANAGLGARMIFKLSREMVLWDTGLDVCGKIATPIWVKENYRMQIARPVRGKAMPIGRSALLWGQGKNPPFGAGGNPSDDYMWVIIRKRLCCVGVTF